MSIGKPNPKQHLFLTDTHRHVAYGGARGGGKSWAVRAKAIALAVGYPGIKILIVRKTFKELQNNHIDFLRPLLNGYASYSRADKVFRFFNGSSIAMGYCSCDSDLDQYQGAEYDVIFLDEAGQLLEEWVKKINACVRGANSFPKRTYYTLNPGGPGHGYFKRLFVDGIYHQGEKPEDYSFIQALVTDNQALMEAQPEYIQQLETLPEKLRKAWLYGDWDVYEGQVFEEWCDDRHHYKDRLWTHVIEPFEIPATWPVWRSMDWGFSHPFSVHWSAVGPDGRVYVIKELYGCTGDPDVGVRWDPAKVAKEICKVEESDPNLVGRRINGVADPAIWADAGTQSIASHMERARLYFIPGNHDRLNGLMQFHYRLAFNTDGQPGMQVFSTCKHLIRTLPLLQYSETHVEDVDTKQEDHAYDEIRYLLMEHPMRPIDKPAKQKIIEEDPLDQFTQNKPEKYDYYRRFDFEERGG